MINIDLPIIRNNMIEFSARRSIWHQLLSMARDKGYKDGWAARKFMEIFECWPNGIEKGFEEPSTYTIAWVKALNIEKLSVKEEP